MKLDRISRIVEHEIEQAKCPDELRHNRAKSLIYYHGKPRGDEREGRSQVVSADVADAVNWILPDVVETFIASEDVVAFDPVGEEDEDQAEQETDYINYVIRKENDAFTVFNEWFQDALLQKNGYVKVFRNEDKAKEREEYSAVTEFDIIALESQGWDVVEANIGEFDEAGEPIADVVVEREKDISKTAFVCVPPEEILVCQDHTSIDLSDARFVAHDRNMPRHELLELGFDKSEVMSLPTGDVDLEEDAYERDGLDRPDEYGAELDKSLQEVSVQECYIRLDAEEDGNVRLYQVWYSNNKLLDIEEADFVPFSCLTPRILSHNHSGESIYDKLKQVQDQKTAIWRQLLDNMYAMNNQRTYVNTKAGVNLNDLISSRIGGLVRGKAPMGEAISPIPTLPIGGDSFAMLEYLDRIRSSRAGVDPENMAQNQMVGNETAHGIERMMSAKEKLVGLIIRTFAETGVKRLVTLIRRIESKYQDTTKVVKLRGGYVPVLPSEWEDRFNTTIKVGLGTGDKIKQQAALGRVQEIQQQLIAGGYPFVTPKNLHSAVEDFGKAAGIATMGQYFTDPDSDEGQAIQQQQAQQSQQPDPNMELLQMQAEIEREKIAFDREKLAFEREKAQFSAQFDQVKQQTDTEQKARDSVIKANAEEEKLDVQREANRIKEAELSLKARELEIKEQEVRQKEAIANIQAGKDIEIAKITSIAPKEEKEVHIHTGTGKRQIEVRRTSTGLEGTSTEVD